MEQASVQPSEPHIPIEWNNIPGLAALCFKVFVLRIITLGLYHFWGKAEVRRRIWNAVHIENQALDYTGTGKELLLGFLIVFGLILLPLYVLVFASQIYLGPRSVATGLTQNALIILLLFLFGVAQYRARRYRLSRTQWRGVRGSMTGSPWRYGWTSFWTMMLIPLTLGWIIPWRDTYLQRILVRETQFGSLGLNFDGAASALYPSFAILWFGLAAVYGGIVAGVLLQNGYFLQFLLSLEGFGGVGIIVIVVFVFLISGFLYAIASAVYESRKLNYFAGRTELDRARFKLRTQPLSLAILKVNNLILAVFTLGIAIPFVQMRIMRYFIERLQLIGSIDFEKIAQSDQKLGRTGEGLAEALDIDAF